MAVRTSEKPGFTGLDFCIVDLALILICLAITLLRLFLYRETHGKLLLADYFAVAAWCWFAGTGGMSWRMWKLGAFDDKINPMAPNFGPEYGLASRSDTIIALKFFYVQGSLYYTQMYLCKASMLAFYHRLFPDYRTLPKLRIALWCTDVFTFCGWLSSLLAKLFACWPVERNWELGMGNCNVMLSSLSSRIRWVPHCLSDVMIYLLPFFLLHHLRLSTYKKIGVVLTFATGFICIFFACLNQASSFGWLDMPMSTATMISSMEETWSCIVINLPAMKILFTRRAKKNDGKRLSRLILGNWKMSIREIVGRSSKVDSSPGSQVTAVGSVGSDEKKDNWNVEEVSSGGNGSDENLEAGGRREASERNSSSKSREAVV